MLQSPPAPWRLRRHPAVGTRGAAHLLLPPRPPPSPSPAIPSTGYPDEARHEVLISTRSFANPHQIYLEPTEFEVHDGDLVVQLHCFRCLKKSASATASWTNTSCNILLCEERNIKVYGDQTMKHRRLYILFLSRIDEEPALTSHYTGLHQQSLCTIQGDYKVVDQIDLEYAETLEHLGYNLQLEDTLDEEGIQNLDIAMDH